MATDKFIPDPCIMHSYQQKQVAKERFVYLSLCPDEHIPQLLGYQAMTVEDFSRITYFMERLGLLNLCCHFQMQHFLLLNLVADNIRFDMKHSAIDTKKEIVLLDQWDKEFLEQLPTERMRKFLKELLSL